MKLETLRFDSATGWDSDALPGLDSENTLVLLFGAPRFLDDPEPFRTVRSAYPRAAVVGCSTSGEILGDAVYDETVTGAVIRFERTSLRPTRARVRSADESFAAGASIARDLDQDGLRGVFLLSDGLGVNGSELVRGLNSVLPPSVVVTGGLAGDGSRFEKTWVLIDGQPRAGWVSAVGLYGDEVRIHHGSRGGWDLFGPERRVTRSRGNVLYELDGKPALALYKEDLGELAADLPASALLFPLSLRAGVDDEDSIVRTILAVSEEDQSMTFAGDITEGHFAQLMHANFDRLVTGASEAAAFTRKGGAEGPGLLAIAISCVGRRLILGERSEEELEASLEALPPGTTQVGFYSYGEISPFASGHCDLHNQTMTITAITEI
jgi:hypothetical protein